MSFNINTTSLGILNLVERKKEKRKKRKLAGNAPKLDQNTQKVNIFYMIIMKKKERKKVACLLKRTGISLA